MEILLIVVAMVVAVAVLAFWLSRDWRRGPRRQGRGYRSSGDSGNSDLLTYTLLSSDSGGDSGGDCGGGDAGGGCD